MSKGTDWQVEMSRIIEAYFRRKLQMFLHLEIGGIN